MDCLISELDKIDSELDDAIREYIIRARKTDISLCPDHYGSVIYDRQRIKDLKENKNSIICGKDELYNHRLLLYYENFEGKFPTNLAQMKNSVSIISPSDTKSAAYIG